MLSLLMCKSRDLQQKNQPSEAVRWRAFYVEWDVEPEVKSEVDVVHAV